VLTRGCKVARPAKNFVSAAKYLRARHTQFKLIKRAIVRLDSDYIFIQKESRTSRTAVLSWRGVAKLLALLKNLLALRKYLRARATHNSIKRALFRLDSDYILIQKELQT
jgi:predicted metallopeptidase